MRSTSKLLLAATLCALASAALAQSSPNLTFGQVPTPAQWNSYFAAKQDYLGSPACPTSGCVFGGAVTFSAGVVSPFVVNGFNSLQLGSGAATGNAPTIGAIGGDTNIALSLFSKGSGVVGLNSNGQPALEAFNSSSSAVNFIEVSGNTTGNAPAIGATGSDTNVALILSTQGRGGFFINAGGNGSIFTAGSAASGTNANAVTVTGANSGSGANLSVAGSDTNITLNVSGKGTSPVTFTQNAHVTGAAGLPTNNACTGFALSAGASDLAGRVTFTSATSCAINFAQAYANAPSCMVMPGSAASTVEVTTTTSVLTATFGTAQTAMFWHCMGG